MKVRLLYRNRWLALTNPAPTLTRHGLCLEDAVSLCPLKDVTRAELVKPQLKLRYPV
jgi:hypothetical protein